MTKRKKTIWLFALMAALSLAWVSCSEDNKENEIDEVPEVNGNDNDKTELPSGVTISFPEGVTGVKYEALSDAEVNKLKAQGHNFVGTPVNVTQDGNTHVVLEDYATVSFKIPDDFPKEQYGELVGVLIGDEGTEYLLPDYAALQKGYVQFKTHHFSIGAAERNKEKLEQLFIEGYAIDNYVADSRKDRAGELKRELEDAVNNVLDGNEDDLLDDVLKQVIESNDIVKGTMEYVEAYEEGTFGDKAANDISEKVTEEMQTKALAILIGKLKKNPDNKKVMECLEKYMTKENVEKIASNLGEATSSYDMALTYAKDFAKGKMEDYARSIFPYVKLVEAEAAVIRKLIKFYNDDRIKNMYNEFAQQYMEHGGQVDWGSIVQKYKLNSPVYAYGMELDEIKDLFERRAKKQKAIDEKKEEMADMIRAWGKAGLLEDHENYFDDCDYEARLWLLYILTEKFRKEVRIGKYGQWANEQDEIKAKNDELAKIVLKYIELYDKKQKGRNLKEFYEWLVKEGYLKKKLEEDIDALKTSGYEFVGGNIQMNIRTEYENGMGTLDFVAGDNVVTMTPKGKGMHFEINWDGSEDKYTDVITCSFDIDDVNLMLENKASLTNISWKRETDNWSGPFGQHFWGFWHDTDFLLKQKQDIAFATSQKIPQTSWNEPWLMNNYWTANWWTGDNELQPSTCYFHRWSLGQYVDGEQESIENGDEMLEGSSISLSLYFNYVEE